MIILTIFAVVIAFSVYIIIWTYKYAKYLHVNHNKKPKNYKYLYVVFTKKRHFALSYLCFSGVLSFFSSRSDELPTSKKFPSIMRLNFLSLL